MKVMSTTKGNFSITFFMFFVRSMLFEPQGQLVKTLDLGACSLLMTEFANLPGSINFYQVSPYGWLSAGGQWDWVPRD